MTLARTGNLPRRRSGAGNAGEISVERMPGSLKPAAALRRGPEPRRFILAVSTPKKFHRSARS
jgi:hypothetical protein